MLALIVAFALSTQVLFHFELLEKWPLADVGERWLNHLFDQLVVAACIVAGLALGSLVPARTPVAGGAVVFVSMTLGAIAGEALLLALRLPLPQDMSQTEFLLGRMARWVAIAGLAYAFYSVQRQASAAKARAHENDVQRMQLERQADEARLESLRAAIEPHFLFNTLANVEQLYRSEPRVGRKMLANFIAYLRAALPRLRCSETTLAQEAELARAYLDVLQVRMGKRLNVSIRIPDELAVLPFPPFALSTLTENAIKHGLNPAPDGGWLTITARVRDGRLEVCVADTGIGLRGTSGPGVGLANLRARLDATYGSAARLAIEANAPRGIRATIAVPLYGPENRGGA